MSVVSASLPGSFFCNCVVGIGGKKPNHSQTGFTRLRRKPRALGCGGLHPDELHVDECEKGIRRSLWRRWMCFGGFRRRWKCHGLCLWAHRQGGKCLAFSRSNSKISGWHPATVWRFGPGFSGSAPTWCFAKKKTPGIDLRRDE